MFSAICEKELLFRSSTIDVEATYESSNSSEYFLAEANVCHNYDMMMN